MGRRQSQETQEEIWIANAELARSPGHPFYQQLNELLDSEKFDLFVEGLCRKFYAARMGRPRKYPPELLDRGARVVIESGRPIAHVARDLGLPAETLRKRVRRLFWAQLEELVDYAADAVRSIIAEGVEKAMTKYNRRAQGLNTEEE